METMLFAERSESVPITVSLRALIAEASDADALFLVDVLGQEAIQLEWRRVDSARAFTECLDWAPDLILAAFGLPGLDIFSMLRHLQERDSDVPCIIVGTDISDEAEIACIRQGAIDTLRRDHLGRLGEMVRRALAHRRLRCEKRQLEAALRESEDLLHTLMDNTPEQIYFKDLDSRFIRVNRAQAQFLGLSDPAQAIGKTDFDFFPEQHAQAAYADERAIIETGLPLINSLEDQSRLKHSPYWLLSTKVPMMHDGRITGTVGISHTVTELMEAERQVQRHAERLSALRTIDVAITASLDLRVTMAIFLEQVTTLLHVDAAQVLLLKAHTLMLEHVAGRGFRGSRVTRTNSSLAQRHAKQAALERRLISVPDLGRESIVYLPLVEDEGFVACFAVPLMSRGQVKGVLELFHRAALSPDAEWLDFLEALAGQAAIAIDNAGLFEELQRSNTDLILAYDSTIEGWSRALDLRDRETEGHSQRVAGLTLLLAQSLGISDSELMHARRGALLHDIGKLGIPDSVLLKPGPLTDDEWVLMRKHPAYAYDMLAPIPYLRQALDIPFCHHEKWDGSGYPQQLKGVGIPLVARIFAVADVWDALRSDRPYRAAWPHGKVREHIRSLSGSHFEPRIVQAFLELPESELAML
jgi:PAS domain S-box-containing protein